MPRRKKSPFFKGGEGGFEFSVSWRERFDFLNELLGHHTRHRSLSYRSPKPKLVHRMNGISSASRDRRFSPPYPRSPALPKVQTDRAGSSFAQPQRSAHRLPAASILLLP